MEEDVVSMEIRLLSGQDSSAGSITSRGTESIILRVKAARDKARLRRRQRRPNIVISTSAHPAFDKVAQLLDVAVIRVPTAHDYHCDVDAMVQMIDDDTFLLAGSAPSLPYGLINCIEELSKIALPRNISLHIDACSGGLLAPFAHSLGRTVPKFISVFKGSAPFPQICINLATQPEAAPFRSTAIILITISKLAASIIGLKANT